MRNSISTGGLVATLMGTGLLVFNALGFSVSIGQVVPTKFSGTLASYGPLLNTFYLDFWTPSQRFWMTVGCLLIVGSKLYDARFRRTSKTE